MEGLKIKPYVPADYPVLATFARREFHPKYILSDESFLGWQYSGSGVLLLALHGREIVGFFGYKDLPYRIRGESQTVRTVMNLYVTEKFRRAGASVRLAQTAFDTPHHILVCGYNEDAQKLYRHLRPDWQEAGNLSRFIQLYDMKHPLLENFVTDRMTAATVPTMPSSVRELKQSGAAVDRLWTRCRDLFGTTVERSADYVQWRFFDHPYLKYTVLGLEKSGELAGYLVYRTEEAQGFRLARVIDFAAEAQAQQELLAGFIARSCQEGAQASDFMFSGGLYRQALMSAGFFDVAGSPLERFPIRWNPLSYTKLNINIAYDLPSPLSDIYLTKADGDQDRPNPH